MALTLGQLLLLAESSVSNAKTQAAAKISELASARTLYKAGIAAARASAKAKIPAR